MGVLCELSWWLLGLQAGESAPSSSSAWACERWQAPLARLHCLAGPVGRRRRSYLLTVSITKGKTTLHAGWNVDVIPVARVSLSSESAGLVVREGVGDRGWVVVEERWCWCSEVAADRRALGNRAASVTMANNNSPSATIAHNDCLANV
jgi:hypothetical protein